MTTNLRYFDIDLDKWLCGSDDGALLKGGKLCCLGFMGRQLGIDDEELRGRGTPLMWSQLRTSFKKAGLTPTRECNLIRINDGGDRLTKKDRCAALNHVLDKRKAPFRFRLRKS